MPLDSQIQAYLDQMAALNLALIHTFSPEMVRQTMKLELMVSDEPESIAHIENRTIPGPGGKIPIRIYTPAGDGPFPLLIPFHGGGWVVCSQYTNNKNPI
jgi:acetyl esterase